MDELKLEQAITDFENGKALSEVLSAYPEHAEEIKALYASLSVLKVSPAAKPSEAAFKKILGALPDGASSVRLGFEWSVFLRLGVPVLALVLIVISTTRPVEAPEADPRGILPEAATFQRTMLYEGEPADSTGNAAPSLMMQKSMPSDSAATDTEATTTDEVIPEGLENR